MVLVPSALQTGIPKSITAQRNGYRDIPVSSAYVPDSVLTYLTVRFYGMSENAREVQMDMREMVDKVKAGQPLYGVSTLPVDVQGMAARQSRYSALFFAVLPWFNFVNHNQHGVDTAKYYQQAERELEAERLGKSSSS